VSTYDAGSSSAFGGRLQPGRRASSALSDRPAGPSGRPGDITRYRMCPNGGWVVAASNAERSLPPSACLTNRADGLLVSATEVLTLTCAQSCRSVAHRAEE
jgi:hypothetical protein